MSKGLCHKCHTSNVEVESKKGVIACEKCQE